MSDGSQVFLREHPGRRRRRPPGEDIEAAGTPTGMFARLLAEAARTEPGYPEAAALATVDAAGRPGVRIVLVKAHGPDGLVFFTSYESDKARALATHPFAELCFHWKSLGKQVRVQGTIERLPADTSDAYFATRDRGSQIGAWASDQSRPCRDPHALETRCATLAARYRDRAVPRPPHWGGYRLSPVRWEFWHERPARLHRREAFVLEDGLWHSVRLFP